MNSKALLVIALASVTFPVFGVYGFLTLPHNPLPQSFLTMMKSASGGSSTLPFLVKEQSARSFYFTFVTVFLVRASIVDRVYFVNSDFRDNY